MQKVAPLYFTKFSEFLKSKINLSKLLTYKKIMKITRLSVTIKTKLIFENLPKSSMAFAPLMLIEERLLEHFKQ